MKETFNQIYEDITKRLYMPMVFYIPRRIWNQFDKEKWNGKEYDNLFDKVVLIKPDGSNALLNDEQSSHHIMIKKERLDLNTFKLLELQSDLDTKQFDFILNKYITQLDFIKRISMWMFENVQKDIENLNQETRLSFQLQEKAIKEHWAYVQKNFIGITQIDETTNEIVLNKKDFKSFQELMNPSGVVSSVTQIKSKTKEKEDEKPQKLKKEKKILVTEEEATDFLLRTVFNMKS
ncbi:MULTISPECIES: hypothetical protein [Bizionia]|uniref:Uncharacterized protein n=1 Tax=Bizionia algoritergicola TaxID=291187 RepID=A0A5D0R297_9FLAO|nr:MULTISPECIES: hypothetical protein [Bizionia]OBX20144.1 hypothetical protein BAA08_14745 [Bizionia sp. APA-3]TYB75653.1 hypothetical protein ES675_05910 [Bizionia algoritergicola]